MRNDWTEVTKRQTKKQVVDLLATKNIVFGKFPRINDKPITKNLLDKNNNDELIGFIRIAPTPQKNLYDVTLAVDNKILAAK